MNKNFKHILFSLIIFAFIIIIFEFGIRVLVDSKKDFLFQTKDQLDFYKKYLNRLNHMRDSYNHPKKPHNYLFNFLYQSANKEKELTTILLQGDSQTEQLNNLKKEFISDIIPERVNVINAGTTSFSPSLMSVQFDILVNDFNIRPNIVVAIIDATDLADENCRYKNLIEIRDNKIFKVHKIKNRGEIYFYENNLLLSEINLSNFPKIIYFPKIVYHLIKYSFKSISTCKYNVTRESLINKNIQDQEYFKNILNKYIDNLTDYDFVEKVFIVSFPHIQHYDEKYYGVKYQTKISDLINSLNLNDDKVEHIDFFKNQIFDKHDNDLFDFYLKGDQASHLTKKGMKLFFKEFFERINYYLNIK